MTSSHSGKSKRTVERKFAIKNSVGRIVIIAILLALQILFLVFGSIFLFRSFPIVKYVFDVLCLLFVIGINAKDHTNDIKLIWVIIILSLPLAGIILYLLFHYSPGMHVMKKKIKNSDNIMLQSLRQDETYRSDFERSAPHEYSMFKYLYDYAHYPFYSDTNTDFYPDAMSCY